VENMTCLIIFNTLCFIINPATRGPITAHRSNEAFSSIQHPIP